MPVLESTGASLDLLRQAFTLNWISVEGQEVDRADRYNSFGDKYPR